MAIKRSATAHWAGNGKEGKGTISTESGVLAADNYSYKTRFEEGIGTNPEELIAAAHAGCFSMKLAFVMQAANLIPHSIDTKAQVVLDAGVITDIYLFTRLKMDGITSEQFKAFAEDAKQNCPVSKLLAPGTNIHLDAELD
jgi:osmotically inducible protein OsmC